MKSLMRMVGRLAVVALAITVLAGVLSPRLASAETKADAKTVNDRAKNAVQLCADWKGSSSWNGTEMTCTGSKIGTWKCELGNQKISCSCQGANGTWSACMPEPPPPSIFDDITVGDIEVADPGPIIVDDPTLPGDPPPAATGNPVPAPTAGAGADAVLAVTPIDTDQDGDHLKS